MVTLANNNKVAKVRGTKSVYPDMIETSYTKVCSVRSERELPDQNDSKCLNSIWKW